MNYTKFLWIAGGAVVACIADLLFMFWSRSATGGRFNKAVWNSAGLGRGRFNIMGAAKHLSQPNKYQGKY